MPRRTRLPSPPSPGWRSRVPPISLIPAGFPVACCAPARSIRSSSRRISPPPRSRRCWRRPLHRAPHRPPPATRRPSPASPASPRHNLPPSVSMSGAPSKRRQASWSSTFRPRTRPSPAKSVRSRAEFQVPAQPCRRRPRSRRTRRTPRRRSAGRVWQVRPGSPRFLADPGATPSRVRLPDSPRPRAGPGALRLVHSVSPLAPHWRALRGDRLAPFLARGKVKQDTNSAPNRIVYQRLFRLPILFTPRCRPGMPVPDRPRRTGRPARRPLVRRQRSRPSGRR